VDRRVAVVRGIVDWLDRHRIGNFLKSGLGQGLPLFKGDVKDFAGYRKSVRVGGWREGF
jgi:hypothetical protein